MHPLIKPNTRLLNVRQPWAWALVNGYKNVENRSKHIPTTLPLPAWVLIVASKSHVPTKAEMKDLERRLGSGVHYPDRKAFTRDAVVGMVRIVASQDSAHSVWYNGGADKAWVIGESQRFRYPFQLKGALTPLVLAAKHPQATQLIRGLRVNLSKRRQSLFLRHPPRRSRSRSPPRRKSRSPPRRSPPRRRRSRSPRGTVDDPIVL